MSQFNRPSPGPGLTTHQGAPARRISPDQELRRTVASCLLWEDTFYESGQSIADRIRNLVAGNISAEVVMNLAIEAREHFKLRHVPLLLVRELLRTPGPKPGLANCIARVIQRPDEISELLAIYWADAKDAKGKRKGLPRQLKKGVAQAFTKFSAYSLAKYNHDNAVKLKDALFMCHAKPIHLSVPVASTIPPINKPTYKRGPVARGFSGQAKDFACLIDGTLPIPDTWEVELSKGADKRATFERLITQDKLGYLALLRNLRNMAEVQCDYPLVSQAIKARANGAERVLPYRFIVAARAAPMFEPALDIAMQASLGEIEKLPGRTLLLVDHSGSMNEKLSPKSDLTRFDAACGLAILTQGVAENCRVFAFTDTLWEVPSRQGMALRDALVQGRFGNTFLGAAVRHLNQIPCDRLIVVTDEQSHDPVPNPLAKGYMLNVASYQNGVGYGPWTNISGWSESSVRFIQELEKLS